MKALAKQICSSSLQLRRTFFNTPPLPSNISNLACRLQGRDIHIIPKTYTHTLLWMHGLGDSPYGFLELFYSKQSPVPLMV